jgi:hypothetical protein
LDELLNWLKPQHNGLTTYRTFQQKALQLVQSDRAHAAAYQLLASLVARFIDHYEEHPLPADVADGALNRLIRLVEQAAKSHKGSAADQLGVLNEIAATELG